MRLALLFAATCSLAACTSKSQDSAVETAAAEPSFDGAGTTGKPSVDHGKRLATMFGCNGCHSADYSGMNFGKAIPIVDGLWASNISLAIPALTDAQLESLLRKGVHPNREIYVMPSKQTQFLSKRDMGALIAFLRTIPQTGKPTPLPPKDFEAAVTARLPDDYWRTLQDGEKKGYHNAAEEVEYYAANRPPDLGPALARGRYIATTVCSSCHGAALDGVGEPGGSIQGALAYDDDAFDRLLTTSVNRNGKKVMMEWGFGHEAMPLTPAERKDAIAYARALAKTRAKGGD